MKTVIYLVRHPEVNNPQRLIYNRLPYFNLSKRGLTQAQLLKKFFSTKNIAAIYSSPLLRTRKTALIIADQKKPVHYSKYLLEANYKKWEGKPWNHRNSKEMNLYIKKPTLLNLGETVFEIRNRITKFLKVVLNKYHGKEIVIVSHADPIAIARLAIESRSLDLLNTVEVNRASVTKITFDNELKYLKTEYFNVGGSEREEP